MRTEGLGTSKNYYELLRIRKKCQFSELLRIPNNHEALARSTGGNYELKPSEILVDILAASW